MGCIAASAPSWRRHAKTWSDDEVVREVERSWSRFTPGATGRPRNYQDWGQYRAGALRALRQRGLPLPDHVRNRLHSFGIANV